MTQPTAPPGWYPVGDSERYWDGAAWTEHVRVPALPVDQATGGVVYDVHGLPHAAEPRTPVATPAPSSSGWPSPAASHYPANGGQYANRHPNQYPRAGFGNVQRPYVPVKQPEVSLIASFFVPGLGSMINGEAGKGVGILVGYLVSCLLATILIGIPGVIAFWVWGLVDAYQGAKAWNVRHGLSG